ncbi:MAG: SUMF1/EgtB/PvdO family nonheme iron enzyme [Bacteroidota bacterium]
MQPVLENYQHMIERIIISLFVLIVVHSGCKKENPMETPTSDTQAPTVSILFPVNGSEMKTDTTYTIIVDANDNKGVSMVEFYIDNGKVGTSNSSPYQYSWNTSGKVGAHSISAKAADVAGNVDSSAAIVVLVKAGTGTIISTMIHVAGGTFQMGSTEAIDFGASPPHSVTISQFNIDKYEITYEKWAEVYQWAVTHGYTDLTTGQNGYKPIGADNPVTSVNWYSVVKWCNARSEKDGLIPVYYTSNALTTIYRTGELDLAIEAVNWTANGYRLPTEAEWEFAARGGNQTHGYSYSGSDTIDEVAWSSSNSDYTTHSIGTKSPNELGIYDMSGNVWEWCWDWYGEYSNVAQTDPKGARSGFRVLRGGSFGAYFGGSRVAFRNILYPSQRDKYFGFRCVQN